MKLIKKILLFKALMLIATVQLLSLSFDNFAATTCNNNVAAAHKILTDILIHPAITKLLASKTIEQLKQNPFDLKLIQIAILQAADQCPAGTLGPIFILSFWANLRKLTKNPVYCKYFLTAKIYHHCLQCRQSWQDLEEFHFERQLHPLELHRCLTCLQEYPIATKNIDYERFLSRGILMLQFSDCFIKAPDQKTLISAQTHICASCACSKK